MEGHSMRNIGSIWWRDLLLSDSKVEEQRRFAWGIRRGLGDGSLINFWKDQWLGIEPFFKVFPILFEACGRQLKTVAELGSWTGDYWRWNDDWQHFRDPVTAAEGEILYSILLSIAPTRGKKDLWVWPHDSSKSFSVKSYYLELNSAPIQQQPLSGQQVFSASLWKSIVPSKVIVFGWRLLLDSLPVRMQLLRRNVINSDLDARCPICHQEGETRAHLFLNCPFATSVWEGVSAWFGVDLDLSKPLEELFLGCATLCKGKKSKRTKHMLWLTTCWSIWLARNGAIFKEEEANVDSTVIRIKSLSWSWSVYRLDFHSSVSISSWWSNPLQVLNNL